MNVFQLWARGVRATNPVEASMQKSRAIVLVLAAMVSVASIAGAQDETPRVGSYVEDHACLLGNARVYLLEK